jgi:PAS domain S-box-containing protein
LNIWRKKIGSGKPLEYTVKEILQRKINGLERHNQELHRVIAEKERMEEKLLFSEERYRRLFETETDAILVVDLNTMKFIDANLAALYFYGYTLEEFRTLGISDVSAEPEKSLDAVNSQRKMVNSRLHRKKDGSTFYVDISGSYFEQNGRKLHVAAIRDVSERVRRERVMNARFKLLQHAHAFSVKEILGKALDDAEDITGSRIGFFHFVEPDQKNLSLQNWSTRTRKEFCRAEGEGLHYPISEAGVWVDCIHQFRPVIHNCYESIPHRKGLPPGHPEVVRELVVPIFRQGKIVAIMGVGNKTTDYDQRDVDDVTLLADLTWEIVERKQGEDALLVSEERYRRLFDLVSDGIYIVDTESLLFIDANEAALGLYGYSRDELLRLKITDVSLEPEKTIDSISSRQNYVALRMHRKRDGTVIPLEISASYSQFQGSQVLISVIRDITERRRDEEALKRAGEYTRSLIEASLDPLVTIGPDGKITDVNFATESATGCSRELLIGTDFSGYFTDPDKARAGYQQVFRDGSVHDYELEIRHVNGQVRPVLYNAAVYRDEKGDVTGVFAAARDITERKLTEMKLSQREREFHSLAENITDHIARYDIEGRILYINPSIEKTLGLTLNEVFGTTPRERNRNGRNDNYIDALERVIATGEHKTLELTFPNGGDGLIHFQVNFIPERNDMGEMNGVLAIGRDITELRQSMGRVLKEQQRLADMALELSMAEERERQAIATELHDRIGQDLALAKMRLGMLSRGAGETKAPLQLQGVGECIDNAISNVRTLTCRLSPPILDSGSLPAALKCLCRQIESDYGLNVQFRDDGREMGVPREMRTELYNATRELLINVAKHAAANSARVNSGSGNGGLLIRVEDDGKGFDPAAVEASLLQEGCGYGLFNIRRRIIHLGGSFNVESSPGNGCRITVEVPMADQQV